MNPIFRLTAPALLFFLLLFQAYAQVTTKPEEFLGHWNGPGEVHLTSGKSERMRCIGNYVGGASNMQQRIRCGGRDFKIETVSQMQFQGNQVRGTFEITTFSAQGTLSGRLTSTGLSIQAVAPRFNSSIFVRLPSRCRQQINITPVSNEDVRSIAIILSKSRC